MILYTGQIREAAVANGLLTRSLWLQCTRTLESTGFPDPVLERCARGSGGTRCRGVDDSVASIRKWVEYVCFVRPLLWLNVKTDIETRAKAICEQIIERFPGREVNLIGHSMGGLDARYLITHLQPEAFTVKTLTTIATPHRGSAFADYLLVSLHASPSS